ncbi:hypothetical protein AAE478_009394 [Parahypoxylon ruwenzoriense]
MDPPKDTAKGPERFVKRFRSRREPSRPEWPAARLPKRSSWANDEINGPLHEPQPYEQSQFTWPAQSSAQSSNRLVSTKSSASIPPPPTTPTTTTSTTSSSKSEQTAFPEIPDEVLLARHFNPKPAYPKPSHHLSTEKLKDGFQKAVSRTRSHFDSMSERPLEAIKRATKAADRTPHLRKKNFAGTDTVDVLDNTGIGGAYHHDGPYDAALASRNRDKRYAPIEAVKYSNEEALKATPRENIMDSLERHVPLQGTASIPPGHRDLGGRVMDYEEGDDLMRESDAPGGPYKRYDHIQYDPNDLKGKGEPSYTIEENLKKQKALRHKSLDRNGVYEMQPAARSTGNDRKSGNVAVRERSASLGPAGSSSPRGKRFSDGIKRRIGSLRRKHDDV